MRFLPLTLVFISLLWSCGQKEEGETEPDDSPGCAWFRQCGQSGDQQCGSCDDGDPCTLDSCINGYTCGHIPLGKACQCQGSCQKTAGNLTALQTLALGSGGLQQMQGLTDVATTADRKFIYVAAQKSGAVTTLVNTAAGPQWAETIAVGDVEAIALSADETRLYATGSAELVVLLRDSKTGRLIDTGLSYPGGRGLAAVAGNVAVVGNGKLHVYSETSAELTLVDVFSDPSLDEARQLAYSADGRHLYVAEWTQHAVTGWEINAGKLKRVTEVKSKRGLQNADAVVVSPDGQTVYVAGFCDHDVAVLSRDPQSGGLTWKGSAWGSEPAISDCMAMDISPDGRVSRPTSLAISPDGTHLVVGAGSLGPPDVSIFERKGDTLILKAVLDETTLAEPVAMAGFDFVAALWGDSPPDDLSILRGATTVTAANTEAFVVSFMTNALEVIEMPPLKAESKHTVQHGQGGVWGIAGCHELDMSPDGRHIYVAPRNQYGLGAFALDPESGAMTPLPAPVFPPPGDEPGVVPHVEVVGPDGAQVVAADAINGVLHIFDRDKNTGELTHRHAVPLQECEGHAVFVVGVRASPDGKHVYVSDFQVNDPSCLWVLERDEKEGLKHVEVHSEEFLRGIEGFELTADGKHLYSANHIASTVAHYERNGDTGILTARDPVEREDLLGAEFLALSPDERTVYVASPRTDDLVVLRRDTTTGSLTHMETFHDKTGPKLAGAAGLIVSPNGKWLYATAHHSDAINVFAVKDDGALTLHEVVEGMDSLLWVNGVRTSPDGRFVYTVALQASAVTAFRVQTAGQDGCGGSCP